MTFETLSPVRFYQLTRKLGARIQLMEFPTRGTWEFVALEVDGVPSIVIADPDRPDHNLPTWWERVCPS